MVFSASNNREVKRLHNFLFEERIYLTFCAYINIVVECVKTVTRRLVTDITCVIYTRAETRLIRSQNTELVIGGRRVSATKYDILKGINQNIVPKFNTFSLRCSFR